MWEAQIDGHRLHFHLYGINNQNFLMRDEETGSYWQQITGQAILGPLRGRSLAEVPFDELTFASWKHEHPQGRVLRPNEKWAKKYVGSDWEQEIAELPVVTPKVSGDTLSQRELVVGLSAGSIDRAYLMSDVQEQGMLTDVLGDVPLVLVADEDGKALRAFDRRVADKTLSFRGRGRSCPVSLVDRETGTEWDFSGLGRRGPLKGQQLRKLSPLADYWFDWRTYHKDTTVYSLEPPELRCCAD